MQHAQQCLVVQKGDLWRCLPERSWDCAMLAFCDIWAAGSCTESVTLYENTGFTGQSQSFPVGLYANMYSNFSFTDRTSSLKVPQGCQVHGHVAL